MYIYEHKKHAKKNIHSSIIHNGLKLETIQMPINTDNE